MNQVWKCAVCTAVAKAAAARQQPQPPVRNATVLAGGTGVCDDHITPVTPAPGQAAARAGLIIPGR